MKTFNLKFLNTKSLLSSGTLKNFLPRFCTKESGSILKNKDQTGETDKSYSGTDTKHTLGSDRVLKDHHKRGLTTNVDDSSAHDHNVKSPYMNTDIPNQEQKFSTEEENKTRNAKELNRQKNEQESGKSEENFKRQFNNDKQTKF
jgi:hypothetical protein